MPDLHCSGDLIFSDVKPNSSITTEIVISNIGDEYSLLNWAVSDFPSWGNWNFSPSSCENLMKTDGEQIITINIDVPDAQNTELTGEVRIINQDNPEDYEIITVIFTTSRNKTINNSLLEFCVLLSICIFHHS